MFWLHFEQYSPMRVGIPVSGQQLNSDSQIFRLNCTEHSVPITFLCGWEGGIRLNNIVLKQRRRKKRRNPSD